MAMKVLVPVDGSKHAMEGLRIAANYARTNGAVIYLLTVIPSVADIDLELTASERDRLLESLKHRGEELLGRAHERSRELGMGKVNSVLASALSPEAEIIAFAEQERIDIIVIGCRGRSASGRFPLGSTAANVVRHSPCCVYVVKEPCWV
jgi:nucleotide-binding universal stress UspA family protein